MRYSRHPKSDIEDRLMRFFNAQVDVIREYPLYYTSLNRTILGIDLTVISDKGEAYLFCFPNGVEKFSSILEISHPDPSGELLKIICKNFEGYDERIN